MVTTKDCGKANEEQEMIREVEQIKMRKDIKYLLEERNFSKETIAEALGIVPRTVRDFITIESDFHKNTFDKVYPRLQDFMKQIKEAEDYKPNE